MNRSRYVHHAELHNAKSASHIVPILIKLFNPSSVLDVGCGTGEFLQAFLENGIADVHGVDGPWLDRGKLVVPASVITTADLEQPFSLHRRFHMVLCLEVAEHLNEQAAATLVDTLVQHSNIIIFSAAIPYQGGQNHINEQWLNYWQELFAKHEYGFYDLIRPHIWSNNDIFWWYRQNIVVAASPKLKLPHHEAKVNNYIHPELYLSKVWEANAYKEWINNIISGNIEVDIAKAILHNAEKRASNNSFNVLPDLTKE